MDEPREANSLRRRVEALKEAQMESNWNENTPTTHDKEYEMVTTRGKTKLWKRLDIAADFIRETCPETKTIVVNFK